VYYTSPITQVIAPGQGTVTSTAFASGASEFASGTILLFQQTSAPTGWTKSTTHNNKALRVVSGSASSGGTVAFTTAFASQAVAGSVGTSGATTLSTSQIPSHGHVIKANSFAGDLEIVMSNGGSDGAKYSVTDSGNDAPLPNGVFRATETGGGGSHDHSGGTFTGTAINLAVQYVDVILAAKD
jgi:hypothetical protein